MNSSKSKTKVQVYSLGDKIGVSSTKNVIKDVLPKSKITFKQKMVVVMLALADFLSFCAMSIMAPFYPKEATERGMSETVSGFVFGIYGLVVFLTSPVVGKVIPVVGVKTVFITGVVLSGVTNLLFGCLAYVEDYTLFTTLSFLIRGAQGLGTSSYCTASFVIITKVFPDHGGLVRGILEVFVGLGLSVGPAIGGFLFAIGGFQLPFFVVGGLFMVVAPFNKFFIPKEAYSSEESVKGGSFTHLLKLPSVLITVVILAIMTITWSSLNPTLEPYLRVYNLSVTDVSFIFLILSATYGISSPLAGYYSDIIKNYWVLIVVGVFFSGISLILLGISPYLFEGGRLWWDTIWIAGLGIFVGIGLIPTYQSVLDGAINGDFEDNLATQGLVAGLWSSIYSLGEAIGPICGGAMLNHLGFSAMIEAMGLINLLAGIAGFTYFKFYRKKNKQTTLDYLNQIENNVHGTSKNGPICKIFTLSETIHTK